MNDKRNTIQYSCYIIEILMLEHMHVWSTEEEQRRQTSMFMSYPERGRQVVVTSKATTRYSCHSPEEDPKYM